MNIEKGKTLLVDGPACVILRSGALRAFGAKMKIGERIVIRRGRRIPLEAMEDSQIDVLLGNTASCLLIDEDPIPRSWKEAAETILPSEIGESNIVIVLGGVDSGKTSFSTYLVNMALNRGLTTAIIDGDLGQSDIGPPGTISLSLIKKPVVDLFSLKPHHVVFIGFTSPSNAKESVVDGLALLKAKAIEMGSNFTVINTDGWVEGVDAVEYKSRLIKRIKPNFIVAIQNADELKPIIDSLSEAEAKILTVEVPKNVKRRDRETRKIIRDSSYKKHLKDAKIRSFPISWIKVDGSIKMKGKNDQFLKKKFEEILGNRVIYCEDMQDCILLVLKRSSTLSDEEISKLNTTFKKPIKIMRKGDERGLLVSLEDEEGRFLGIGIIHHIDYENEKAILKIRTNVGSSISKVNVGWIRLDEKGNEVEVVSKIQQQLPRDIDF